MFIFRSSLDIKKRPFYLKGISLMPRERAYDRQKVLGKATEVFWKQGYEFTSVSDLVAATGLNTASMYKEFGSKEEFFCAVMDYAWDRKYKALLRPLTEQPGLSAIRTYLTAISQWAVGKEFHGCLYMNILSQKEIAGSGPVKRVKKFCTHLQELFETNLRAAQKTREIPAGRDPVLQAHFLVCFVQGLAQYARIDTHKSVVTDLVENVIASLSE